MDRFMDGMLCQVVVENVVNLRLFNRGVVREMRVRDIESIVVSVWLREGGIDCEKGLVRALEDQSTPLRNIFVIC